LLRRAGGDADALARFPQTAILRGLGTIHPAPPPLRTCMKPLLLSRSSKMKTRSLPPRHVYLMASGDLRLSANQKCWPVQAKMEAQLAQSLQNEGWTCVRAHPFDPAKKH